MPRKHHGDYEFLVNLVGHQGDECVTWPFSKDKKLGRGNLCRDGVRYWAHRLMCELQYGPAPEGKTHAAHNCGKGHLGCVNPKHLEWKRPIDNFRDKITHGTNRGNETGPRTRLAPEAVADIQSRRLTQWAYAEKYGMSLGGVQYWQRVGRAPIPPGTSKSAVNRRRRMESSAITPTN